MRAIDISYYIIKTLTLKQYNISNLKLQKLLYLIYKESLKYNQVAFTDNIEMVRYNNYVGYIIPDVYHRFSVHIGNIDFNMLDTSKDTQIPNNILIIVNDIINKYGDKESWEIKI